jgi:hypothetical protein
MMIVHVIIDHVVMIHVEIIQLHVVVTTGITGVEILDHPPPPNCAFATLTVLVAIEVLPARSVTVYVI